MKRIIPLVALSAMLIWSCGSGSGPSEADLEAEMEAFSKEAAPDHSEISAEAMEEIKQTIPSPIEMTTLIKETGASYSTDFLNDPEHIAQYSSSFQKSLNLGVYGADLGYLNLYEKTRQSVTYLGAVRDLADDLKLGQFFDYETIRQLAENKSNPDSLVGLSTRNFNKMDQYLREKDRGNVSILILYGGWLEGLYIASEVAASSGHELLRERIAEQKIVLDDLILLVSIYKSQPYYEDLLADLETLKAVYNDVNITFTYAEPELKEVEGRLVLVDNRQSEVEISDETMANIRETITDIRNNITL